MKTVNGNEILKNIKEEVSNTIKNKNLKITLATILVGNNESSKLYVNMKEKACKEVGINVEKYEFPENAKDEKIIEKIMELNKRVDGVLVQLPLPNHLHKDIILNSIKTEKDVDGLTINSLGKLLSKDETNAPCTAKAVIHILDLNKIDLKGKNVVLVGHSNVGKPLSIMLLNRDATLDVCNAFTVNLKKHTLDADILISCTVFPNLISKDMIKEGAIVIDVGINKKGNKVVGDVELDVEEKSSLFSPVPGGVGPITIAMLIKRLVK